VSGKLPLVTGWKVIFLIKRCLIFTSNSTSGLLVSKNNKQAFKSLLRCMSNKMILLIHEI